MEFIFNSIYVFGYSLPVLCLDGLNYSLMFWALSSCIFFHCSQWNTTQGSCKTSKCFFLESIVAARLVHKFLNSILEVVLPCLVHDTKLWSSQFISNIKEL